MVDIDNEIKKLLDEPVKNKAPFLMVIKGKEKGEKKAINKKRFIIGRKVGDLLLDDAKVSSAHLALEEQNAGFMLIDLDSTNGTLVNGKRVKMALLNFGDEIQVGSTVFRFEEPDPNLRHLKTDPEISLNSDLEEIETGTREKPAVLEGPQENSDTVVDKEAKKTRYTLKLMVNGIEEFTYEITSEKTVIGRVSADINLEDKKISRKHAMLEIGNNAVMLRDLSTDEGLFVNDRRIVNCKLRGGEKIQLGDTILEFNMETVK